MSLSARGKARSFDPRFSLTPSLYTEEFYLFTGNVNACVIIATREYVANGAEPTCMAAFKFN